SSGLQHFFRCAMFNYSIYVVHCLYIRSLSVMLSRISFHVLYGRWLTHVPTPTFLRSFRTPCRHCFPRFTQRFARSSVPVLDRRMLVEIPTPVTIHTWLERFNKQKPHSFKKATAPFEGNALAWWKAYKQDKGGDAWLITETWADFKKLFFLQFFPRAEQEPAGTEEEQAKNFHWGLRRSTLNHLMCMSYTDVAQVANAARNYEILHERDDDDAERPNKW
nr:hypothetical protein [Tanacetum cinerariifolium]